MLLRIMICWLLAWATPCWAMTEDALVVPPAGAAAFAEGKKLLDAGQDGRAAFARAMQAIQKPEIRSPDRTAKAQNFGNAAFLAGDVSRAILAYRQGLFHDRHHAVMRGNLDYARSQVRYPPAGQNGRPEPDFWPAWLPRLRITWLFGIGAFAYCTAWLAVTGFVLRRDKRLAAAAAACFALAAAAAHGCHVLRSQWTRDTELPPVVILYDDVPLRIGNSISYPRHAELPTLFRGMEARQLHVRGDWRQIQFHSGEIGWIPAHDALTWSELWQ